MSAQLVVPVGPRDHVRGPAQAPVTLVEYGDYECPYSGAAYPIIEEVRRRLGDDLRFVFRHFPLSRIHPHAAKAAEAAEAAAAQGTFWPMHDLLFTHQDALEEDELVSYAAMLGLDLVRFSDELTSGVHAARVRDDFMNGVRSGVAGTARFFINGRGYAGVAETGMLLAALRAEREALYQTSR